MPSCFVFGCKTGYNGSTGHHMFRVPIPTGKKCPDAKLQQEWISTLRKVRTDKTFDPKNESHRVCSHHFRESDIVSDDIFVVGGKTERIRRQKWKLLDSAIPTIFNNVASYAPKPSPKKRKNPDQRRLEIAEKKRRINGTYKKKLLVPTNCTTDVDNGITIPYDVEVFQFTYFRRYFQTNKNWEVRVEKEDSRAISFLNFKLSEIWHISRQVRVNDKLEYTVFFENQNMTDKFALSGQNYVHSNQNLSDILEKVLLFHKCSGISGFQNLKSCPGCTKSKTGWKSSYCDQVSTHEICIPCKQVVERLTKRLERTKMRSPPKILPQGMPHTVDIPIFRKANRYYRRRIRVLQDRNNVLRAQLRKLKTELKAVKSTKLASDLQDLNLPTGMKSTILEAVSLAQRKSSKGMRYSTEWLLECSLLLIKSPSAYNHLRNAKILPLPNPRTIKNLLSGSPCEFGFNQSALDAIQREMNGKPRRDRQGVLCFDEIKLRKTLDFNKGTLKFDGFIDYGDIGCDVELENGKPAFADHALVLMYRPYNSYWVQPVAAFATKGAASGQTLSKIVTECVHRLENSGAEVLTVVYDGATTNKAFWNKMGVNADVNKVLHPCDISRHLFFASDVPHIIKCIRNNFQKHKEALYNGTNIDYKYYERLFEEEAKSTSGLRKCPKLTPAHVRPNNFQKMVVPFATQLFSRTVALAIRSFREAGHELFEDSLNTEIFTLVINDVFDCLNSRLPKEGLYLDSPQMTIEFLFNRAKKSLANQTKPRRKSSKVV